LLLNTGWAGVESTTTTTVPGNDLQLFNVAVTLYVPLYAVIAFDIIGFCAVLVNPVLDVVVQLYVMLPVLVVLAFKFKVVPLHIGAFVVAVGVAGGVGSDNVTGPAMVLD
jgi:hypothetical protein